MQRSRANTAIRGNTARAWAAALLALFCRLQRMMTVPFPRASHALHARAPFYMPGRLTVHAGVHYS